MIKVSVIIPVYNAADTIERCVDSILQIRRDDVEVVLVEDCSTVFLCVKCWMKNIQM